MDRCGGEKIVASVAAQQAADCPGARTIAIAAGPYCALIDRDGAALQGLWWVSEQGAEAIPLVETYAERAPFTCGQTLIPWPNRIADGRFCFCGRTVTVEMNEPELCNAIHGLAMNTRWEVGEVTPAGSAVTLRYYYEPVGDEGWPWRFSAAVRYTLSSAGLTAEVSAKNESDQPMPWGYGAHPYITAGGVALDECTLWAAVDEWWPTDCRNLPTGEHYRVGEGVPAIHQRTTMKDVWFDTPFTISKESPVELGWREVARLTGSIAEERSVSVVMDVDAGFSWLQIFTTGEKTVMFPGKTAVGGRALAVEPMTCPPNAMVTGQDVITLAPLAEWSGRWRLRGEFAQSSLTSTKK